MFAVSFDTSSSTYRPSHHPSAVSSLSPLRTLPLHTDLPAMDISVQPFNTGGVNSPGAPPTEYAAISLDTEMLDEDEVMAMGDTLDTPGISLETPTTGEPAPDNVIPNKVHLRGLDNMSSDHVKTWVATYFPEPEVEKLEWIDDTSLNLVFQDDATALAALTALSTDTRRGEKREPWELREARSSDAFPLARLDVRLAYVTDRKEKGARERSRYYLFHPEDDRIEQQEKRKREQEKERRERREYRRRDYDDRRYRSGSRGEDWEREDRRSRSRYDEDDSRRREPLELFPNGATMDRRGGRRSRSRSPVELFPEKTKNANVELFPESTKEEVVELFPDKVKNATVELFPGNNGRQRQGRDESPAEFGQGSTPPRTLFSIDDPVEISRGQSPQRQRRERERPRDTGRSIELFPDKPRSLAGRIDNPRSNTRGPKHEDMDMGDSGLSIRGSAGGGGISIRGAAKGQAGHSNAGIELLPDKASNSLFNRIEPTGNRRGARRQKAEDMFG